MKDLKEKLSKLSVLVFGDIFLDKEYIGTYTGKSQEQDNLSILKVREERNSPGGGGNLAACFASLGVTTNVLGLCGDDINGRILESVLLKNGVKKVHMVMSGMTLVFGKFYLEDGKHIFRYDITNEDITDEVDKKLIQKLGEFLPDVDMIACADYNNTDERDICSEKTLNFISKQITPKFATGRKDIRKFKNFTCLLLNDNEFKNALDKSEANNPLEFTKDLYLREIVITKQRGAISYTSDGDLNISPTATLDDVLDTCGCGDMFYATYVSCKMAGYNIKDSLEFANCAAGIVAKKKFGASQATINDIIKNLE